MEKLNTHYYDGKLVIPHTISSYLSMLRNSNQNKLKVKKQQVFDKLILVSSSSPGAIKYINTLKANIHSGANFDSSDKIYACDLLYILAQYILENITDESFKKEFLPFALEQIADISKGACPQGRVKRLMQVVTTFS